MPELAIDLHSEIYCLFAGGGGGGGGGGGVDIEGNKVCKVHVFNGHVCKIVLKHK